MTHTSKIPEGYRQNANGDLVLLQNIKAIDLERDELVLGIAREAENLTGVLAAFKGRVFDQVAAFVKESAEKYKAKLGGLKGNITLYSFDGLYKVQIANQDDVCFDERLKAAEALIHKCIKKWADGANDNLMALVNDAFQVDRAGNISVRRVLGLRRLDIKDRDWKQAMDAISDSLQVVGSKSYIRVYRRQENGEYTPIALDVSAA